MFCLFCFLSLGCCCFAQEQPAVTLSSQEVREIRIELQNMRRQVMLQRESLETSERVSKELLTECDALEKRLREAATALAESEKDLVSLERNRKELEELLTQLRKEYSELNQYCQTLERRGSLFKWIAVGGIAVGVVGAFAAHLW